MLRLGLGLLVGLAAAGLNVMGGVAAIVVLDVTQSTMTPAGIAYVQNLGLHGLVFAGAFLLALTGLWKPVVKMAVFVVRLAGATVWVAVSTFFLLSYWTARWTASEKKDKNCGPLIESPYENAFLALVWCLPQAAAAIAGFVVMLLASFASILVAPVITLAIIVSSAVGQPIEGIGPSTLLTLFPLYVWLAWIIVSDKVGKRHGKRWLEQHADNAAQQDSASNEAPVADAPPVKPASQRLEEEWPLITELTSAEVTHTATRLRELRDECRRNGWQTALRIIERRLRETEPGDSPYGTGYPVHPDLV